jgi:hypothetical protein
MKERARSVTFCGHTPACRHITASFIRNVKACQFHTKCKGVLAHLNQTAVQCCITSAVSMLWSQGTNRSPMFPCLLTFVVQILLLRSNKYEGCAESKDTKVINMYIFNLQKRLCE